MKNNEMKCTQRTVTSGVTTWLNGTGFSGGCLHSGTRMTGGCLRSELTNGRQAITPRRWLVLFNVILRLTYDTSRTAVMAAAERK